MRRVQYAHIQYGRCEFRLIPCVEIVEISSQEQELNSGCEFNPIQALNHGF